MSEMHVSWSSKLVKVSLFYQGVILLLPDSTVQILFRKMVQLWDHILSDVTGFEHVEEPDIL